MITTETPQQKRTHIYEIDLIRAITVFSVVAIHSLSYTGFLVTAPAAIITLNLIGHALHFNREMFMFVTGLVLTYVYFNKPFSAKKFWLKRASLVFIPYALWSIIYVLLNNPSLSFIEYVKLSGWDILTGDASFQLYYILLSLQFYAIFPFFLLFLKKVARHPWITLSVSLLVQLIFIYLDFHYLQTGPLSEQKNVTLFVNFQDRIIFIYQFFFLLGSFAAIYMADVKKIFKNYGKFLPLIFIVSLIGYYGYSYLQLTQFHFSLQYGTSVLQPSVVIYSIVVIAFFCWLATIWAKKLRLYSLIKIISNTSFGIYFVHVLFLSLTVQYLLPFIPSSVPALVKILFVLFFGFATSVLFCFILLKIPFLSWTIGRSSNTRLSFSPVKIAFAKAYRTVSSSKLVLIIAGIVLLGILFVGGIMWETHTFSYRYRHKPFVPRRIHHQSTPFQYFSNPSSENSMAVLDTPVQSTGCNKAVTFNTGMATNLALTSSGIERTYRLFLPLDYLNSVPHALILDFHGYSADAYDEEVLSQFVPLSNQKQFIMVYPNGTFDSVGFRGWNTGLHPTITANDVLFVSNLMNQLQSNLCINPNQIYATGFSNGGGFVNMLACKLSNRIAAFAPVSGSYVTPFRICNIKRPVPIVEFHGTADKTVPYDGNTVTKEFPVLTWINDWTKQDGCLKKPTVLYSTSGVIAYSWPDCKSQASVIHYKIIGERHTWPRVDFQLVSDGKTHYVNAATVIWDFFQQHPLPNVTTAGAKRLRTKQT